MFNTYFGKGHLSVEGSLKSKTGLYELTNVGGKSDWTISGDWEGSESGKSVRIEMIAETEIKGDYADLDGTLLLTPQQTE